MKSFNHLMKNISKAFDKPLTFLVTENKELFLTVKIGHGKKSTQAFLKVAFRDNCCSQFIQLNDLFGDLSSKANLFSDDTSLFNLVHDINTSSNELNSDRSKRTQEVISSRKLKKIPHPPLVFNNDNVSQCKSQKHLGIK